MSTEFVWYNPYMNEIKERNLAVGARLKALREARGWTYAFVAKAIRVSESTVKHNESGRRGVTPDSAPLYAKLYGVSASYIQYGEDDGGAYLADQDVAACVPVYGEAAGGVWLEGDDRPIDESYVHSVAPVAGFPISAQYARKVVGNSVSRHIRDGEYAIFVRFNRHPGGARVGDVVDVQRVRAGLREHTVKVYKGRHLLETDSLELSVQEALPLSDGESDTEVSIVGIAVGVFRPLRTR